MFYKKRQWLDENPSKFASAPLTQISSPPHEIIGHFLCLFLPHFRYNIKQILRPVLTPSVIKHSLHIYKSSWPISWEFLHGLKRYLKNKQTKQLNLSICYKSLEGGESGGQWESRARLSVLKSGGIYYNQRGKGKPCKSSLYPVISPTNNAHGNFILIQYFQDGWLPTKTLKKKSQIVL